jgi:hypothetical protein
MPNGEAMPPFLRVIRWRSEARTEMARLNRKRVGEIFATSKPDYMVFLEEIARAGVVRYRVDMCS